MKLITIEANIGAGKSTLIQKLPEQLEEITGEPWLALLEPVDQDPEFHRLLKQFIDNPNNPDKRIEFQKYITESRASLLEGLPDGNYIIERSLFSDLIFSQMNFLSMECPSAHYMSYFYDIKRRLVDYPQVDVVIYIDREPEACAESIVARGREGEHYEMDYLLDLKRFHDACLPQITREYNTKLITLNVGSSYASEQVVASLANHSLNKEKQC